MAYFIPSFFQKRLLRYVLSKLNILDTDAIGLDDLDITWGKKSVVELRDVSIHKSKVASLLHLPQGFHLSRAKVDRISISIPADLYKSPVEIDIAGLRVVLESFSTPEKFQKDPAAAAEGSYSANRTVSSGWLDGKQNKLRRGKSDFPPSSSTPVASSNESDGLDSILLNPTDLAYSFLAEENEEEKDVLRSALHLAGGVTDTGQNSVDSDIAADHGVGHGLSLPAFLANFLDGIVERLEISILDLQIDIAVTYQTISSDINGDEHQPSIDQIIRLSIESIESRTVLGRDSSLLQHLGHGTTATDSERVRQFKMSGCRLLLLPGTHPSLQTFKLSQIFSESTTAPHEISQSEGREDANIDADPGQPKSSPVPVNLNVARATRDETPHLHAATSPTRLDPETNKTFESTSLIHSAESESPVIRPLPHTIVEPRDTDLSATLSSSPGDQSEINIGSDGGPPRFDQRRDGHYSSDMPQVDMTKSCVYDHGEATSIYMSALTSDDPSTTINVPGAWTFATDDERGRTAQQRHMSRISRPTSADSEAPSNPFLQPSHSFLHETAAIDDPRLPAAYRVPSKQANKASSGQLKEPTYGNTSGISTVQSPQDSQVTKPVLSLDTLDILFMNDQTVGGPAPSTPTSPSAAVGDADAHVQGKDATADSSVHINAASIDVRFDVETIRILSKLGRQFQSFWGKRSPQTGGNGPSSPPNVTFKCESLTTRFVTSMHATPTFGTTSPHHTQEYDATEPPETLFKAILRGIKASSTRSSASQRFEISAEQVSFGYEDQDILAFQSLDEPGTSVADSTISLQSDLVFILEESRQSKVIVIDVKARPLNVLIDLQRLDETCVWLGGLSTILELTSSLVSTLSAGDLQDKDNISKAKKTVRFDDVQHASTGDAAALTRVIKLNLRLRSLRMEIKGRRSSLNIKSSAIKIVKRSEGLGVQVDSVGISGPNSSPMSDCPSYAEITRLRLEYLATPKEADLSRLSHMVVHSASKHNGDRPDELMIDTLLRQRRQGGLLRLSIASVEFGLSSLIDIQLLLELSQEMKNLGKVAKYLPEDDRPGLLLLISIKTLAICVPTNEASETLKVDFEDLDSALVTFPYLFTISIFGFAILHDVLEDAIAAGPISTATKDTKVPVVWARYIGNEMVPVIRVRIQDIRLEYCPALLAIWQGYQVLLSRCSFPNNVESPRKVRRDGLSASENESPVNATGERGFDYENMTTKTPEIDLVVETVLLGLDPASAVGKAYVFMKNVRVSHRDLRKTQEVSLFVERTTLLITPIPAKRLFAGFKETDSSYAEHLSKKGYVIAATAFSPNIHMTVAKAGFPAKALVAANVRGGLLVLETCADSTQTLQRILSQVLPPTPKTDDLRYRTEAISVNDMLDSFTGDAYIADGQSGGADPEVTGINQGSTDADSVYAIDDLSTDYVGLDIDDDPQALTSSMLRDDLDYLPGSALLSEIEVTRSSSTSSDGAGTEVAPTLDFQNDHFSRRKKLNRVGADIDPFSLEVNNFHLIWNLFDGYDWSSTRESIEQAVIEVQAKVKEDKDRKSKGRRLDLDHLDEDVVGDFLFNSIYIGIPRDADPAELLRNVNDRVGGLQKGSSDQNYSVQDGSQSKSDSLRLKRSKSHKMTFELKGISCSVRLHSSATNESQSTIELKVHDLEIFDHLPSSTWKKFATYMRDAGERESDSPMVSVSMSEVRPIPDLAATELQLRLKILPLRLHVDQDALDFLARFFTFRDERAGSTTIASDPPFIQRAEVNAIRIKLDFKPKRVDYAGLRAGRTSEFMNFFVLDQAEMVLRHVILYGISGFDRLGQTLNDLWTHDVKQNQLPGVVAGVGAVQPLVGITGGIRDLIVVPITEYRKDGRVFRSLQKGALAFAKTTTSELVKLGAKLAIGTQNVLENAETAFQQRDDRDQPDNLADWDYADLDQAEKDRISPYAAQPIGVFQGLRGAFASLERDLLTTKDVIIAMPGEIMEQQTTGGVVKTVMNKAPILILKPAVGVTKAVGQTLMGVTNALDPGIKYRLGDKYKSH